MRVSVNWIKFIDEKYSSAANPMPDGIDKLVEKIGAQLGGVEEVIDLGKKYQGILVVMVVASEKHPNADKLSFCLVDDSGVNKKVKRNKDGLIEIVCGAPNVKAGMLAAWIPPGATVPSSPEADPFVIEEREIRGIVSHGMLASPKELDLGDSHTGLLEIEEPARPGQPLAEALGLDDYIIDIENKMFTHRPDCFGMLGIAREIAGIQGQVFKSPAWYREDISVASDGRKNVLKLEVKNQLPKLMPRFCAVAVADVKVADSPAWLKVRLASAGVKSINNIVDITNYLMLETGQPLHAYDYDKLATGVLGIRMSKKGEQLKVIGGKTIKLEREAVVITDGHKPIGLGGVIGGAETEVDDNTKNIVIECANFDMNATRRTAMAYGLFTDAATRFTKGQSPRQNLAVIIKALDDVKRLAGGRQASKAIDDKHFIDKPISLNVAVEFVNQRLGANLSAKDMQKLLENVEFKVTVVSDKLRISVPFWRTDIEIAEDIVEEVGRLYGYDKLPMVMPGRDLAPADEDKLLSFKARLRDILAEAGANEVLTYSFVHGDLLKKVGQDPSKAYQLANALSPDLQYYRLSVMPSLLEKINPNLRARFSRFGLFELGKGHNKNQPKDGDENVPAEFNMLAFIVAASDKAVTQASGSAYFQARAYLDFLASRLGINLKYDPIPGEQDYPVSKPYDYSRSAAVSVAGSGLPLGMVGEFRPQVAASLKLPRYCAGFEIGVSQLLASLPSQTSYQPLPRFPEVDQDITLRTPASANYAKLHDVLLQGLAKIKPTGTWASLEPVGIYQKEGDASRNMTYHLKIASYERTLTTDEVNALLDELAGIVKTKLGTERI